MPAASSDSLGRLTKPERLNPRSRLMLILARTECVGRMPLVLRPSGQHEQALFDGARHIAQLEAEHRRSRPILKRPGDIRRASPETPFVRPNQTKQSDDLTFGDAQIDRGKMAPVGEAADLQANPVRNPGGRTIFERCRPSDHVDDQLSLCRVLRAAIADQSSITQNNDAIAVLDRLVEPVGDEDDADAGACQFTRQSEQSLRLDRTERRRRFIEDKESRLVRDGLGELEELLLAACEESKLGRWMDMAETDPAQNPGRRAVEGRPAEKTGAAGAIVSQEYVLRDGH